MQQQNPHVECILSKHRVGEIMLKFGSFATHFVILSTYLYNIGFACCDLFQ